MNKLIRLLSICALLSLANTTKAKPVLVSNQRGIAVVDAATNTDLRAAAANAYGVATDDIVRIMAQQRDRDVTLNLNADLPLSDAPEFTKYQVWIKDDLIVARAQALAAEMGLSLDL